MSHYTVAVFSAPGGKTVEQLLAPYHKFECTGRNDEFVKKIDLLPDAKSEFEKSVSTKLVSADGIYHNPWYDRFYRDPTEEEKKKLGRISGSGFGNGISWTSKDWGDGRGYRTKINYVPEGYEGVEVKTSEVETFKDYVVDQYGFKEISEKEIPDIDGENKYGWIRISDSGEVLEVVRRTNPDSKWDWYQVGGRYSGRLMLKSGATSGDYRERSWSNKTDVIPENMVDTALLKDIDFEGMCKKSISDRKKYWAEAEGKEELRRLFEYGIEKDMTYDEYTAVVSGFSAFAVILPTGEWYEKGKMGWWAIVENEEREWNEKFKERFLDTANPEWTLTLVDCHI